MQTFDSFAAEHGAAGADEVLERGWKPNTVIDTHTHAFSVQALVVQGEMWLTVGERYGPEGATYWVARRNGKS